MARFTSAGRAVRVAIGLATVEREQALLSALIDTGDVVVAARCLAAESLVEAARSGQVDAILAAFDLHRLNGAMLTELGRTGFPLLLLAPQPFAEPWVSIPGRVLPLDAPVSVVHQTLLDMVTETRPGAHRVDELLPALPVPSANGRQAYTELAAPLVAQDGASGGGTIIAVSGGPGSPGRTTVAINLAVALGAVAPTILVDADLAHPSVAVCLDTDVTRNLSVLAHGEPATDREWERALEQETQPLSVASQWSVVLCGVAKPEMRAAISSRFFTRLLDELRQRYRYVVVDIGVEEPGADGAIHRCVRDHASQVLLVVSADLLGLHAARTALGTLQHRHGQLSDTVTLVINRYDPRYHYGRAEIEWSLGLRSSAVVPHDHRAVQRALAAQQPVLLEPRSRAAHALLDLATRLHQGSIVLPRPVSTPRKTGWLQRLVPSLGVPLRPRATPVDASRQERSSEA